MIQDDLRPTIEELLSFAYDIAEKDSSREIDQVKVKIEEALFWLSYHDQKKLQEKIEQFGTKGEKECPSKVLKLQKSPLNGPF
jgi:hypothetical protein